MISIADFTTQTNMCKTLAIALPNFYKKTQISAQFNFVLNSKTNSIEISLGFSPKKPTDEEYKIFFEELNNAEKHLLIFINMKI